MAQWRLLAATCALAGRVFNIIFFWKTIGAEGAQPLSLGMSVFATYVIAQSNF